MKAKILFIFLILLGLIPLLDLFHPGLPITHDGQDHVARIANFYQNLSEGNIIPRWAGNLNWGYGHPILMFLYPLPSYIASLFHFLGFSLVDSVKIVFGAAFVLSGLTMYLWIKNFLGSEAGFIAGILYMFAPYRFVDLYVRGALGEHVAFVFPPLILYFVLKLSKKYSYWFIVGGSISLAGLILSHNAISLMFLPIIILYAIFFLWSAQEKKLLIYRYISIFVLGLGLAAFFWMPAFFEGKYTLRDIVTAGDYKSRFVLFKDLIYGAWNYGISGQFSVQVGILHWFMVLFSIPLGILLYKKFPKARDPNSAGKNRLWILSAGSVFVFFVTLFLMNQASNFIWENVKILQKFQFPWRFLSVTIFAASVLGGLFISIIPKRIKFFAICFLLVAILFFNKDYWQAKGYINKPESFFTTIYNGTTDTGESSPIWSVRFMLERPKTHTEVIDGKAKVVEIFRNSTNHEYEISVSDKAGIRENTVYFPGWRVLLDGKQVPIEFQDPNSRGLMTFYVPMGKHQLSIEFAETKFRTFSNLISLFSLGSIVTLLLYSIRVRRGL